MKEIYIILIPNLTTRFISAAALDQNVFVIECDSQLLLILLSSSFPTHSLSLGEFSSQVFGTVGCLT